MSKRCDEVRFLKVLTIYGFSYFILQYDKTSQKLRQTKRQLDDTEEELQQANASKRRAQRELDDQNEQQEQLQREISTLKSRLR